MLSRVNNAPCDKYVPTMHMPFEDFLELQLPTNSLDKICQRFLIRSGIPEQNTTGLPISSKNTCKTNNKLRGNLFAIIVKKRKSKLKTQKQRIYLKTVMGPSPNFALSIHITCSSTKLS
jgi:hypothetical protein